MLKELGKACINQLKIKLKYKYSFVFVFVFVVIISLLRINLNNYSNYGEEEKEFKLTVQEIKMTSDEYTILFNGKENLIAYCDSFPYDVGDVVLIKGELIKIKNNTIPNLFNYRMYLQSRKVFWQLKIREINLLNKNGNILNKIRKRIVLRINNIEYKEYLYAFLLGDTSQFSDEIKNDYRICGLYYVLTIGSLQIMAITRILDKIKGLLKIKKSGVMIDIIVISSYIILMNGVIGVLRSGLCYLFKKIFQMFKIKIKYYNIILLVGTILLIFNPYYLNNTGFLYSFVISFAISILNKRIKGSYFKRLLTISFIAFLFSLPITLYTYYEIDFLTIIFSFLLVPLFYFIVFPLCIIVFIFPFLSFLSSFLISFAEYLVTTLSHISFFVFVFRKPSMIIVMMYYMVISLSFYQKKYFFLLSSILFIHLNINAFIKETIVTFLDVKQADAIVIKENNKVSMIDTSGNNYHSYSDDIIKYLKSLGISKIDNLILTHGDYDHMGDSINLVENFKVEKVIFNCGEYNNLEKELIKVLDKKKIKYYRCVKELNVNNIKYKFLNTKIYNSENSDSIVLYLELSKYKFLFMGDATIEREKDIIAKYNLSMIDVLKVGHHGSKTSSSEDFINKINPKYAIISVGKNNIYHHPNKEVLKNLENTEVFRTDENGSIEFKVLKNKLQIKTYEP